MAANILIYKEIETILDIYPLTDCFKYVTTTHQFVCSFCKALKFEV